jgi:uncharacterized linocin/CFP29 family protein
MLTLNWTEAQNKIVRDLIAEEVEKARLSHTFIPELKLDETARSVMADEYDSEKNAVNDVATIPLVELTVNVRLTKLQAEDADLGAALLLIRRAANRLARAHDAIVFAGQPGPDQLPPSAPDQPPGVVTATGGQKNEGLSVTTGRPSVDVGPPKREAKKEESYGENLVASVADALVRLEKAGYIGSYVLVLGQTLFTDANTPSAGSLVLPKDRLEKLLAGGPVHRSSVLPPEQGLLMSLGGEPMDRAVAVAPKFEFLRIENNETRVCRVFERFALRLKEKESVIKLVRK